MLHEVAEEERDAARAVRARVLRRQPLHPGRARRRDPHAGRARAAHRRLQDGPAAARRPAHRPRRLRPARPRGHRPAAVDSTNAEVPGFVTPEREIGPVVDEVVRTSERTRHRRLLRQPRAPRAAGARRRRRARPPRRLRRPLDGPQHGRRPRPRLPARAGRADGRHEGRRAPARRPRSCWSRPGRRASRCRRCRGWPTGRTTRSASRPSDTVVLASSLIPGNENAVYRVINGLSRWGARVVHKGVAQVHVSGHAPAGELLYLLNATKPSQPHAGARRVAPPARARRAGPADRRAARPDRARRGRRRRRPRRRQGLASSARCRAATSSSTASRSATSASRPSRTGASSATRASSRSPSPSTRVTGKIAGGPEIARPRLHRRPHAPSTRCCALIEAELDRSRRRGRRRRAPARAERPPGRRPLGQRHLPPPPDDRPGRHRGLSPLRRGHRPAAVITRPRDRRFGWCTSIACISRLRAAAPRPSAARRPPRRVSAVTP